MISRFYVGILLGIAVLVWGAMLYFNGESLSIAFFKPFSVVSMVLGGAIYSFNRWIWRWPSLYPWLVSIPNLQGTWKGQIISNWIDPNTGNKIPPVEAFLTIRQTYFSICLRMITRESYSNMLAGKIYREPGNDTFEIAGIYQNVPRMSTRERSPIHHGGIILHVRGDIGCILDGSYWTDRETRGEIRFAEKAEDLFDDYERAVTASYQKP